jgi:leucyl-tRNA synthetase
MLWFGLGTTATNKVVNTDLVHKTIFPLELNTMPGWAEVRFTGCVIWMHNEKEFASKEALAYWESVDLYIGGNEHADIYSVLE